METIDWQVLYFKLNFQLDEYRRSQKTETIFNTLEIIKQTSEAYKLMFKNCFKESDFIDPNQFSRHLSGYLLKVKYEKLNNA